MSSCGLIQPLVRAAPVLLNHVNLLLMLGSGGALATSARLAWDPSAYLVLTLIYPAEYHLSVLFLPIASIMLICLAHMALIALHLHRSSLRRVLLYLYAALMATLALAELICLLYIIWRPLQDLVLLLGQVQTKINKIKDSFFSSLLNIEFLRNILNTIEEINREIPFNLYIAGVWSAGIGVLQVASIVLALLAVRDNSRTAIKHVDPESGSHNNLGDKKIYFSDLTQLLRH